jgi:hypothetical protein
MFAAFIDIKPHKALARTTLHPLKVVPVIIVRSSNTGCTTSAQRHRKWIELSGVGLQYQQAFFSFYESSMMTAL